MTHFVSDQHDPFPHHPYQSFDTAIYRYDHIHSYIDPNHSNDNPPSLIRQFDTSIEEPSEHQTGVGDTQYTQLVEYLLELSE